MLKTAVRMSTNSISEIQFKNCSDEMLEILIQFENKNWFDVRELETGTQSLKY